MFDVKKLMIIPFLLLLVSVVIVGTGARDNTIPMSIDLKGGTLITIQVTEEIPDLEKRLGDAFDYGIHVRVVRDGFGNVVGEDIEIDETLNVDERREVENFLVEMGVKGSILTNTIWPTLSEMFIRQAIKAIVFAFSFMAVVVFLRFRTFVPSFAVILSAFSDIVVTLAIMIVLNIQLSLASFVALLLLLGYSVDTDILLTTKLLVRRKGDIDERIKKAMGTGLTMSGTTLTALVVLLVVSTSRILDEIAMVLVIGLVVDLMNTWIQNVGILRIYLERA